MSARATSCLLALAVALAASGAAAAPPTAQAHDLFQRGVKDYKEGDFNGALVEFKRAYEIAPNYLVLYNLGQTALELQDYAQGIRYFHQYLKDGGKDVAAARTEQVQQEIDKAAQHVGTVRITTNADGANVTVDDVSVGKSPLAGPVLVNAGQRRIAATKGGATAVKVLDVAGGDTPTVDLEIAAPTPPPATPRTVEQPPVSTPPPSAPEAHSGSKLWIGITVTGVLAAGAVATGIAAIAEKSDYESKVATFGSTTQQIDDARSRTQTFAAVADILTGAAVVSGAVTLVVAILSGRGHAKESAVHVGIGPGSVSVGGVF